MQDAIGNESSALYHDGDGPEDAHDDLMSSTASSQGAFSRSYNYHGPRLIWGHTTLEWSLLTVMLSSVSCSIALTIAHLVFGISSTDASFTLDIALLFIYVYSLILGIHGIIWEKQYDLYLYHILIIMSLLFGIVDCIFSRGRYWPLQLVRPILGGLFLLNSLPLMIKAVRSVVWMEFVIHGTSNGMIVMFRQLCYFNMLLKMDFMMSSLFGIFYLIKNVHSNLSDYAVTVAILTYATALWVLGALAVKKEVKCLAAAFVVLSVALPVWLPLEVMSYTCLSGDKCKQDELTLSYTGAVMGCAAVVVKMYVFAEFLKVYRNFGYGLSDPAFHMLISPESTSLLARSRSHRFRC